MVWTSRCSNLPSAETKGGLDSPAYLAARAKAARLAGPEGIDRLMKDHRVDLLVGATNGPAWTSDLINGDHYSGPSVSQLPAVAGYPHLTVPMGVQGLPIGLSFIGGNCATPTCWRRAMPMNRRARSG